MLHRLTALLLCFLFATQAFAVMPSILSAPGAPHAAMASDMPEEHCAGMTAEREAPEHCPHCQDLATSSGGCASACFTAGIPGAPMEWRRNTATVEFPRSQVAPLLTRSDIPPTPPPIA